MCVGSMESEPNMGKGSGRERTAPKRTSEREQEGWVLWMDVPRYGTSKKPVTVLTVSEGKDVSP